MIIEREGEQVYLDIQNALIKAKKKRSKSLDDIDLSQLSEEIYRRRPHLWNKPERAIIEE